MTVMTKVVANKCYGGFGLSRAAFLRLREMGNKHAHAEPDIGEMFEDGSGPRDSRINVFLREIPRDDPQLVEVVLAMGREAASRFAELAIIDVPDGCAWEIDEYDGFETVREPSRTWG
jgi:hypothetical protein